MKFNIFDLLLPRETKFFNYMEDQILVFIQGCNIFKNLVIRFDELDKDQRRMEIRKIKDCEKKGDVIELNIIAELHRTFITPIDREDIHSIVVNVDNSLDILNEISQKIEIYKINKMPPNISKFAEIISDVSFELGNLITSLKEKKDVTAITEKIHGMENESDYLFHTSMADLFSNESSPIDIIKFKEIYEHLEAIVDSVDFIAKVIRGIMIKLG